jgi:hypothetical protein
MSDVVRKRKANYDISGNAYRTEQPFKEQQNKEIIRLWLCLWHFLCDEFFID